MCVSLSQKPMQSARVLPPPPGALGLSDEGPGDSARSLAPVEPPVENCVGSDGERGAIAGAWGAGDPTMEGGVEAPGVTGAGGGPLLMVPPLDEPGLVGRVGPGDDSRPEPEPERTCATAGPPVAGLSMCRGPQVGQHYGRRRPLHGRALRRTGAGSSERRQPSEARREAARAWDTIPFPAVPARTTRGCEIRSICARCGGQSVEKLPGKSAAATMGLTVIWQF